MFFIHEVKSSYVRTLEGKNVSVVQEFNVSVVPQSLLIKDVSVAMAN